MNWKKVKFINAFDDITGGNQKFKQNDYFLKGEIPIVDQGRDLIAGYIDDKSCAINNYPVIVFGDHTRVLKYIDFPFALGADGVKLLKPKSNIDVKFAFYALQKVYVPNTGYNRHFKWLKESEIPLPDLKTQQYIAQVLDKADALRQQNRQLLAHYDELLQSTFIELFGDDNKSKYEVCKLEILVEIRGGLQVSASARSNLSLNLPYLRVANVFRNRLDLSEIKNIELTEVEFRKVELQKDDLLIVEGHGNKNEIGRAAIWDGSINPIVHQNHLIRVRPDKSKISPTFLCHFINSESGKNQLRTSSNTTSGLNTISTGKVKSLTLPVPPLPLQEHFAKIVEQIEFQKAMVKQSLSESEALFEGLLADYFG